MFLGFLKKERHAAVLSILHLTPASGCMGNELIRSNSFFDQQDGDFEITLGSISAVKKGRGKRIDDRDKNNENNMKVLKTDNNLLSNSEKLLKTAGAAL